MLKIIGIILFFVFVGAILVGYTLLVFREAGEASPMPAARRKSKRARHAGLRGIGHHLRAVSRARRWRTQAAR